MRARAAIAAAIVLGIAQVAIMTVARPAFGKAVENIEIVMSNETNIEKRFLYYENLLWVQKSWKSASRTKHTLYLGSETLLEPMDDFFGETRWGFDTHAVFIGYKFRTYLPDWYNFNIRLRIPAARSVDPHGRKRCTQKLAPSPGEVRWEKQNCTDRVYQDRFALQIVPLLLKKSWNLFTVYDRNRIDASLESIEYRNKLKLIRVTPDLEYPIAMYIGDELRLRKNFLDTGFRVRNDLFVGLASNFFDWLHVSVEFKFHLDTKKPNVAFITAIYLELYYEMFFDNTFGAIDKRAVYEEARD